MPDVITCEIKTVEVGHEESEREVNALFTGKRTLDEMVAADVMNPQPLPHELVAHLDQHALDDLAKAIHRPETSVAIRSPTIQKCASSFPLDTSLDFELQYPAAPEIYFQVLL
jgi:hypothetical protein